MLGIGWFPLGAIQKFAVIKKIIEWLRSDSDPLFLSRCGAGSEALPVPLLRWRWPPASFVVRPLATVSPAGCPVDHEDGSNSNSEFLFLGTFVSRFRRFSASSIAPGNWSYGRAPAWCGVGVYERAFKLSKWLLRLCAVASPVGRSLTDTIR